MLTKDDKEKLKAWTRQITQALLCHPPYAEMSTEAIQLMYKLCDSTNRAIMDLLDEANKDAN